MGYRHVPSCTIWNDKSFECCWETFGVFPDKALCHSCRFFLVSLLLFMCNVYMRVHAFMHMSKPGVDTGCVWDRVSNWTWYSSIARLASKQAPETCLPAPTPELWLQVNGTRVVPACPTQELWLQTYGSRVLHAYLTLERGYRPMIPCTAIFYGSWGSELTAGTLFTKPLSSPSLFLHWELSVPYLSKQTRWIFGWLTLSHCLHCPYFAVALFRKKALCIWNKFGLNSLPLLHSCKIVSSQMNKC